MTGADTLVELPSSLRNELKAPMGPIYTDPERLLADAVRPIVAVGDIVTYHLLDAGTVPDVALVDERTKRSAVDSDIADAVIGQDGPPSFDRELTVENPPAALTEALLDALGAGLERTGETTLIVVDGEEDLAALPAVLAVPDGASVVYGQPDEGMVLVTADVATRERVRSLLERMDGDTERLFSLLES